MPPLRPHHPWKPGSERCRRFSARYSTATIESRRDEKEFIDLGQQRDAPIGSPLTGSRNFFPVLFPLTFMPGIYGRRRVGLSVASKKDLGKAIWKEFHWRNWIAIEINREGIRNSLRRWITRGNGRRRDYALNISVDEFIRNDRMGRKLFIFFTSVLSYICVPIVLWTQPFACNNASWWNFYIEFYKYWILLDSIKFRLLFFRHWLLHFSHFI